MTTKTIFDILIRTILGVCIGAVLGFSVGTVGNTLSANEIPYIILAQDERMHTIEAEINVLSITIPPISRHDLWRTSPNTTPTKVQINTDKDNL